MWSEGTREAYRLAMRDMEYRLLEFIEVVEKFISEYRFYILIGSIILVILVILDLLHKRREKREKKQIEQRMKDRLKDTWKDTG
jgi:uncharacterized membrane protein